LTPILVQKFHRITSSVTELGHHRTGHAGRSSSPHWTATAAGFIREDSGLSHRCTSIGLSAPATTPGNAPIVMFASNTLCRVIYVEPVGHHRGATSSSQAGEGFCLDVTANTTARYPLISLSVSRGLVRRLDDSRPKTLGRLRANREPARERTESRVVYLSEGRATGMTPATLARR
jgi:hypothetical protein